MKSFIYNLILNPPEGSIQHTFEKIMLTKGWTPPSLGIHDNGRRYLDKDVHDLFIQFLKEYGTPMPILTPRPVLGSPQQIFQHKFLRSGGEPVELILNVPGSGYLSPKTQAKFEAFLNEEAHNQPSFNCRCTIPKDLEPKGAKMVTTEQLNQVGKILGTTDKNIVISAVLKTLVENGIGFEEAFDSVFGEGAYEKAADEIWEVLRSNV